ncbi:MAG: T9SS type A sorting domain-containing protein, partial [Bacteroidia bacterium]|nr:T9SS type A sorting domain-containing protein [Bacteroidia bacterium]
YYETNGGYFILEFEDINSSSIGMDLQQNELVLYPNPTAGSITISNFNDQTELLVLHDFTGKVILSKKVDSESSMLLPNLENGVYLISAFDRSMKLQSRKKLVVCKL